MAIQIREDKLSEVAKKALNNSKSKSQFVRDAIEFYVKRESNESALDSDVKRDIQEIKALLIQLRESTPISQLVTATEQIISSAKEEVSKAESKSLLRTIPKEIHKEVSKEPESMLPVKSNKEDMSDEEKRELERLIDMSLENF